MSDESSAEESNVAGLTSRADKRELPQPDVLGIPALLVWALGCMASLLLLFAVGLCLYSYWAELHVVVKAGSQLLLPVIFWGVYLAAARKGHCSTEVVALLTCLSWAAILLIVQTCVYEMQLWLCGLIFVGGLVVLPVVHPWRSGIVTLAMGSLLELALLALACAMGQISYSTLWLSTLTLLMLWTLGGCWCLLTKRCGYRSYGVIAAVTFVLFLVLYYTLATFPQFLLPDSAGLITGVWGGAVLFWLVPMLLSLPLHSGFARRNNRAVVTSASMALWLSAAVSVPLLMAVNLPFLSAPAALLFALSLIYYGAVYKFNWPVLAGCVAFFVSVISILLRLGIHPIGAAVVLILLSGATFYITLRLHARRRVLLSAINRVHRRRRALAMAASKPDEEPLAVQKEAEQPGEQQKA
ncbi:MAG: hypothetical protein Q4F40_01755 [Akkermansia sp.]|nr:hypothetical protein [Akkermansia sp.]